jgi:hypothetical protein
VPPPLVIRITGLLRPPQASTIHFSGWLTAAKSTGPEATTTESMSSKVRSASARARSTASRTRPAWLTSERRREWWVWPEPTMATGRMLTS